MRRLSASSTILLLFLLVFSPSADAHWAVDGKGRVHLHDGVTLPVGTPGPADVMAAGNGYAKLAGYSWGKRRLRVYVPAAWREVFKDTATQIHAGVPGLRLSRAPNRRKADIILLTLPQGKLSGAAGYGSQGRVPASSYIRGPDGRIRRPASSSGQGFVWLPHRPFARVPEDIAQAVLTHELGHTMRLSHYSGGCAVMNPRALSKCAQPPVPWETRCRYLQPGDVRALGRSFGTAGRPALFANSFCDFSGGAPTLPVITGASVASSTLNVALNWATVANQGYPIMVLEWAACRPIDSAGADPVGQFQSVAASWGVESLGALGTGGPRVYALPFDYSGNAAASGCVYAYQSDYWGRFSPVVASPVVIPANGG